MQTRRRRKGRWQSLGAGAVERLNVSDQRRDELALMTAWSLAAGEQLRTRAKPRWGRGRRLELQRLDDDPSWTVTLLDLAPALGAAIARRLRRRIPAVRVLQLDGTLYGDCRPDPEATLPAATKKVAAGETGDNGPIDQERLERVARRYLTRSVPSPSDGAFDD